MRLLRSVNAHVVWADVLAALDASPASRGTPARVRCPVCHRARMTVFQDTIFGGAWHYCFTCRKGWDTIELAAAVLGTGVEAAVADLTARGLVTDRVTAAGAVALTDLRGRADDVWRKAKKYMPRAGSPVVTRLRDKFRLGSYLSPERWLDGPGRFVGAYPYSAFEKITRPVFFENGGNKSSHRVFRGRKWSDVLAVAFEAVPGQVCGFLCVGRAGRAEDTLYRPVCVGAYWRQTEAGLGCLSAVRDATESFGGKVVVCGDAMFAVRLQIRHFAAARAPLPLVAYYDGLKYRTRNPWASLEGRTPVLWGWRLTPSLLAQAIAANGEVSVTRLATESQRHVDHYVRQNEPRDILRVAVQRARPWAVAAAEWAGPAGDGDVKDMVAGLEAYGVSRETIARLGPRFAEALPPAGDVTVRSGGIAVVERGDEWWAKPARELRPDRSRDTLVMNATLRVDEVVPHDRDPGVAVYRGRMRHAGFELPFETTLSGKTDTDVTPLQLALSRYKPGAVLYVDKSYNRRRLLNLGSLFNRVA